MPPAADALLHGHEHPAFTPEALRRAWRKVRAAGGGAGMDGVDLAAFERRREAEIQGLRGEVLAGRYRPRAIRRVFVRKADGGLRPLTVWTVRDRVAQRAVHDFLEPHFEALFLDCSHGYRPGRSVASAVQAVVDGRNRGLRWVLDADIRDCFARIDGGRVLGMVEARVPDPLILALLEGWLAARAPDRAGRREAAGVSQGGVLSPLLSNVYLHAFDAAVTRAGVHLVRYADDLVCLTRRRREAEAARVLAAATLAGLGLELHPRKTRVVHLDAGFVYLGTRFLRNEVASLRQPESGGGRPAGAAGRRSPR